jgi:hypothetical protein
VVEDVKNRGDKEWAEIQEEYMYEQREWMKFCDKTSCLHGNMNAYL